MPEVGGENSPELEEKGRQVTEYYESLPLDAPVSPPPPILKDLLRSQEDNSKEI